MNDISFEAFKNWFKVTYGSSYRDKIKECLNRPDVLGAFARNYMDKVNRADPGFAKGGVYGNDGYAKKANSYRDYNPHEGYFGRSPLHDMYDQACKAAAQDKLVIIDRGKQVTKPINTSVFEEAIVL